LGIYATLLGTGVDGMNESKPGFGSGVYVVYGSTGMGGGPGWGGGEIPGQGGNEPPQMPGLNYQNSH
ncbi:MAG: hypothetical protein IIZ46_05235, partial [Clostridia bacterium]|nr:hypothetical protein [Clostridia bacterium]